MPQFQIGDKIIVRGEITHVERAWVDVMLGSRFYTRMPIQEVEHTPEEVDAARRFLDWFQGWMDRHGKYFAREGRECAEFSDVDSDQVLADYRRHMEGDPAASQSTSSEEE